MTRLLAWPFVVQPIDHGVVNGISWAVAPAGPSFAPCIAGYAQIPAESHPWSTCNHHDDLPVDLDRSLTFGPSRPENGDPGLTMADCGGWIGFHTNEIADIWTDHALAEAGVHRRTSTELDLDLPLPDYCGPARHWTLGHVITEAQHLARQIAAAGAEGRWRA